MFEEWNVTLPALTGDQPRKAYLYLPSIPQEDPHRRFPVLYMFDGHNLFFDDEATYGKSWGLLRYMEETDTPLIIAAVECNHGLHHDRLREYCPFTCQMPEVGLLRGRGRATMEWLLHQFKPYIDANYPTLPQREYIFIGGSSMGGLMSLYAITRYNRYFSRCAALSPSLWVGKDQVEKMLLSHRIRKGSVVYMDYGERELGRREMAGEFGHCAAMLMEKGALVTCRIVPGGDHNEASWEEQIPFFMDALFYHLD